MQDHRGIECSCLEYIINRLGKRKKYTCIIFFIIQALLARLEEFQLIIFDADKTQ